MTDSNGKIPDAVVAVLTQLVLGVGLATSAVPPTVLSVQDRGSETMGVFLLIIVTGVIALPVRRAFGRLDLAQSEYVLVVMAPIITRLDLGLMIWVNVNKALVWAEQMLYASIEEIECVSLLILASRIWHNGDNRIFDPEFGLHGGEAAVLMYKLQQDYNPRNAGENFLAWFGHFTLWPFAWLFHLVLQVLAVIGFAVFWVLARLAYLTGRSRSHVKLRGPYFGFLLRSRRLHQRKLFMRREVAAVLDSNMHLIKSNKRELRQKWAMLGSVDAILHHPHFRKLMDVSYPMRAPLVLQRALVDPVCKDVTVLLNQHTVLYTDYPDNPLSGIGEQASRQIIQYRVMAWPKHTSYSKVCLERLEKFAEDNISAWQATEHRLLRQNEALSEFLSVRDILRRFLVQLVMLAWCDGLGECLQSGVADVPGDLAKSFLKTSLPGIEMAVRLCNIHSTWNDESGTSVMIQSLVGELAPCQCALCNEMAQKRRLTTQRYLSKPNGEEVAVELERDGCERGLGIGLIWGLAVRAWIRVIFKSNEEDQP